MSIREIKRAVAEGRLIVCPPGGPVEARTEFQRKRLTEAMSLARIYLEGEAGGTAALAAGMGVTSERAAQIVRLGLKQMEIQGWLRPKEENNDKN